MKRALTLLTILLLVSLSPLKAASSVFDPRDFGAKADGQTLDTKAIQAAVDACAKAGGGRVYLHDGRFLFRHAAAQEQRHPAHRGRRHARWQRQS